ncbi:MAG: hypothetical protein ACRDVC_07770 [Acidimicrobiales bacterium]
MVFAEIICIPAFVIELLRAINGNELSWAYVFEWPALGCYGVYMWHKMIQEERGRLKAKGTRDTQDVDSKLEAWNEYLASVHQPTQPTAKGRDV